MKVGFNEAGDGETLGLLWDDGRMKEVAQNLERNLGTKFVQEIQKIGEWFCNATSNVKP